MWSSSMKSNTCLLLFSKLRLKCIKPNLSKILRRWYSVSVPAIQHDYNGKKRLLRREKWESVVGLEIHAQIYANSKLFSGSGTSFYAPVNTQVSLVDAAFPGTLPVLNKRCVEAAVLTSLALGCRVNPVSEFDRKHYFYADLPAGYQITQQRRPIAENGKFAFAVNYGSDSYIHEARIKQIQIEQDSGKSLHSSVDGISLIDLNRAGVALMEIVFDANLSTGYEAYALVEELQLLLVLLGTCNGKMAEGSLRVDANVSVNRVGEPWGVRTEVKNLNSLKSVANAIEYEIERQILLREKGELIENETRTYDMKSRMTVPMRDKEAKQDYRFMPEPNLPPLRLDDGASSSRNVSIKEVTKQIPSVLPFEHRLQLMKTYGLSLRDSSYLIHRNDALKMFQELMNFNDDVDVGKVIYFMRVEVPEYFAKKRNFSFDECPVSAQKLMATLLLAEKKQINTKQKEILLKTLFGGDERTPEEIVAANKWTVITDPVIIERICKDVIENNPNLVTKFKGGKGRVFRNLMAIARKSSKEELDTEMVSETFKKLLSS